MRQKPKTGEVRQTKTETEGRSVRVRRRDEEFRRRLEQLRRQIKEARERRQRLLLLILLILLALLVSACPALSWLAGDQQEENPASSKSPALLQDSNDDIAVATAWTPSPEADYAPSPGEENYCDGYSFAQWTKMADARGISMNSRAARQRRWEADPERELYPLRYRDWGYKPYLGEIMDELRDKRWGADAFLALKIMSPPEVHQYLDEAYVSDPSDIRLCRADFTDRIIQNLQSAAIGWELRKLREQEEARRQDDAAQRYDMPPDGRKPQ